MNNTCHLPEVWFGDTEVTAADDATNCGYDESGLLANAFRRLEASDDDVPKDKSFDKIINCCSQEEAFRLAHGMNRRQHPVLHGSSFNSHDRRPVTVAYVPFHYHPFGMYVRIQKKWCDRGRYSEVSEFRTVNMHLNFRVDNPKGEDSIALHNNRKDFGEAAAWATLAVTRHDQLRTVADQEKEKRIQQLLKEGHTEVEAEMIYVSEGLEYVKDYVKRNDRLSESFHE